jgi:putative peptidoglycan lipid II flippase
MSLLRSSAVVAAFTLLSRIFGFLRDVVIANVMGAGMLSDAFFIAFKIPNFLRRLFAEGAFNAAFLPMFAGMLKVKDKDYAMRFASDVMSSLAVILLLLSMLIMAIMPWVIDVLAPGFRHQPELYELSVELSRITFPYLFFISLVSLLGGVLNSFDKFAAVAFAPVLLNVALVACLLGLSPFVETPAHALSIGVFIAGILQLIWLVWMCKRHGSLPRFVRPEWNDEVRHMLKAFAPVAFGAGVIQVNQMIDIIFATYIDNAVSYLYYADRLYELPLGVIGIAVATALLPMLSRYIRAQETEAAAGIIEQALRFVALIGLPATVALVVLADPIVRTIYEHGEFGIKESEAVIPALIAYSCGLPAFLLIKIFASCFFAATDTKTPVKIAVICMLINLALNMLLIQFYAHVGLAIATSVAGWVNATLLGYFLYQQHIFRPSRAFIRYMLKLCMALAVMVAALWGVYELIEHWFTLSSSRRGMGMVVLVMVGMAAYFSSLIALRAVSREELRHWVKKTS